MKENDYKEVIGNYNGTLSKIGKRIRITEHDDDEGFYAVEIITEGKGATLYADGCFYDELAEVATEAFIHACMEGDERKPNNDTLRYVKVSGGKDGQAAQIDSLTDYPVYFHCDESDELLRVGNYPFKGTFEESDGSYYVRADDYEDAMQKIERNARND